MNQYNCAVLIPSCDAYSDLWRPFFTLFFRYWADCPFEIYLGSDSLCYHNDKVETLNASHNKIWSNGMIDHLSKINSEFVLIMLEDFFLRSKVDTAEIIKSLNILKYESGHCFRLIPRPKPDLPIPQSNYGKCSVRSDYRVSTQAAIWRKSTLLELLKKGESIWEFEINGSIRAKCYPDGFFASYFYLLPYGHHVVQRGRWFPWEATRFNKMNIGCDFTQRSKMSVLECINWLFRKVIGILRNGLRI